MFLAICTMVLAACSKGDEEMSQVARQTVQFTMVSIESRASLSEASCGYLYVYDDGELIETQTSEDENFGSLTLDLDYGQHNLSFVAAVKSLDDSSCADAFGGTLSLDVSSSTGAQEVTLSRVVSRLKLVISDAIPSSVSTVTVTCNPRYIHCGADLLGVSSSTSSTTTIDISKSRGKQDVSLTFYSYCPSLTDEWSQTVDVVFKNADGDVVASRSGIAVPLRCNRETTVRSYWFSSTTSMQIGVDTDWLEGIEINS